MNLAQQNIAILGADPRHQIYPIAEEDVNFRYAAGDDREEFFQGPEGHVYQVTNLVDEGNLPDPLKREAIFIIGIAGVEEIQAVLAKAHPASQIIIIEPNTAFLLDTIQRKDLSFLAGYPNVRLLAMPVGEISLSVEKVLSGSMIFLIANLRVYLTDFYRKYQRETVSAVINHLSVVSHYVLFNMGNDIGDSLLGLNNNLRNIRYLPRSYDVAALKGIIAGKTAIVVSSGPSLEKNIKWLHQAKGRCVILAADSILARLRREGIVPDFVCSIERYADLFDYCYKDKNIPEDIILVAPPVVQEKIVATFPGPLIMPLRGGVREYLWLNDEVFKLDEDAFVTMGASVAHLAYGFALHMGAATIILAGQDLAYGPDERSHASGTIYDNDGEQLTDAGKRDEEYFRSNKLEVDGYYGGKVVTHITWSDFRKWFESRIPGSGATVINATEGGARIAGTVEMPLAEAVATYCREELDFKELLKGVGNYPLDLKTMIGNLDKAGRQLRKIWFQAQKVKVMLSQISIEPSMTEKQLLKKLEQMKKMDAVIRTIQENPLLLHIFQPYLMNIFQRFYKLPEKLEHDNVRQNLMLQEEFLFTICEVMAKVMAIVDDNLAELKAGQQ